MDRVRRWQLEHPEAYRAMIEVGLALRAGKLVRPAFCQICNDKTRVVAQHRDYNRPLDVVWVCYLCRHRHQKAVQNEPVPLFRRPTGYPPAPRPTPQIQPLPFCAAWTAKKKPCSFPGRFLGSDGLAYCGHHYGHHHQRKTGRS